MEAVDTLISARWIIPIEPAACVLEHHAVAIRQGRIVAILPTAHADLRYAAHERVDRPSHVLLPGFINVHVNVAQALPPRPAAQAGMHSAWADPEFVRDSTELSIARMIGSGTTCFADHQLFPDIVATTAAALHVRASVGLPIRGEPTSWASTADEYFEKASSLHDEYRADPLIATAFSTGPANAMPDELFARLRPKADEIELPVVIPLHESAAEIEQSLKRYGCSPVERLERLDLVTPQLVGLHLTQTTPADRDILGRGGAHAVASPRFDLLRRTGCCAISFLRAHGINVALGTGAASSADIPGEVQLAALLSGLHPDTPPLGPHEALHLATLGGARALGLADSIGSLLPGKWADLCCMDLAVVQTQPVYDVPRQVVHGAAPDQVTDVWVAGRAVLGAGNLVRLDVVDTLSRAARWYS